MALIDKNILITPNIGSASDPNIVFSGADGSTSAQNITLSITPTSSGTLAFTGSTGQLLGISNTFTGTTFAVNDVNGIPNIKVIDDGTIHLAPYSGSVKVGTSLYSTNVGGIYAPGMVIQTVYVRYDGKDTYSAPVNANTEMSALTTSITPKYATSKILVTLNISFEMHYDTIFRLSRNDTIIGTNSTDAGRWSGWANPGYDTDTSTTPRTNHYMYVDTPGTTSACKYKFLVSSSGGTAYTMYLNRTVANAGADTTEVAITQVMLQEIAQ